MWPLTCILTAGALISPFKSPHSGTLKSPTRLISAARSPNSSLVKISMMGIAKKSSDWAATESDLLAGLGLSGDDDASATTSNSPAASSEAAAPAPTEIRESPRSGTQPWGRWSHESDAVELDIMLPDGARARDVVCEVSKQGLMRVQVAGAEPPLLSGTVALPIDRTELAWAVEEQDDGRRLLCIELPLYPADPNSMKCVDCIFDESLNIDGKSCIAPGLSGSRVA